jgi:hypothetical protein
MGHVLNKAREKVRKNRLERIVAFGFAGRRLCQDKGLRRFIWNGINRRRGSVKVRIPSPESTYAFNLSKS